MSPFVPFKNLLRATNQGNPRPQQMDALSEMSQSALEALVRNYVIIIALAVVVLAFALYVYFFPTPFTEYFKNPEKEGDASKKLPATGRV